MLLLLLAAVPAALQPAAHCPRTTSHHAVRPEPVRPRKLNQLPDANAYAAVYRRIRGCEVPMVVRYGIGAGR